MNISPITTLNFGEQFKTKDVISFISHYPLSGYSKEKEEKFFSFLTQNISEDIFEKSKESDFCKDYFKIALKMSCIDEIVKQNEKLQEIEETCNDYFCTTKKDYKKINDWVQQQIKRIGSKVDIEPIAEDRNFEFKKKLDENYTTVEECFDYLFS